MCPALEAVLWDYAYRAAKSGLGRPEETGLAATTFASHTSNALGLHNARVRKMGRTFFHMQSMCAEERAAGP